MNGRISTLAWGCPPRSRGRSVAIPDTLATPAAARVMRSILHPTAERWRVSEVNSDVCGGFTESSRFAELVALRAGDGSPCGDAGAAWTDAVASCVSAGGLVVLLSAPGWVEDMQVVAHLAARLRARGLEALLASPHHLRWVDGRARIDSDFRSAAVDAVIRFYQVESDRRSPLHAVVDASLPGRAYPRHQPGMGGAHGDQTLASRVVRARRLHGDVAQPLARSARSSRRAGASRGRLGPEARLWQHGRSRGNPGLHAEEGLGHERRRGLGATAAVGCPASVRLDAD